jgi:nuclear-control-of-ATPase protein 2
MDLLKASPSCSSSTSACSCRRQQQQRRLWRLTPLAAAAAAPLPVAAIDCAAAAGTLHALRRALSRRPQGAATTTTTSATTAACDLWLSALCRAQEASDRLLADLDGARRSAAFWRGRMRAGGHGAFMLLGRGPTEFAAGVVRGAAALWQQRERRGLEHDGQEAAAKGGGGGGGDGNDPAAAAEGEPDAEDDSSGATYRIQERIDALDALSRRLAVAVSRVHRAADLLRLELPPGTPAADAAAAAAAASASAARMAPAAPLASADPAAAERSIALCLKQLRQALEDVPRAAAEAEARRGGGGGGGGGGGAASGGGGEERGAAPNARATPADDLAAIEAVLEGSSGSCPQCCGGDAKAASSLDAAAALRSAHAAAAVRGPLAPAPAWARIPSRLQRHWLRYALLGACALGAGTWAVRHREDLERWRAEAGGAAVGAWRAHVVEPLSAVRRELFATLRDRPAIVSPGEFAEDREALLRMLRSFEEDHRGGAAAAAAAAAAAGAEGEEAAAAPAAGPEPGLDADDAQLMSRGMARVMRSYERELRQPLRNLFAGSLARAVLIQVQRLKLDTEAAMLELDQILKSNELSLTLVAAVPSAAIAALLARGAWRLGLAVALGAPPDPKREAGACRVAMAALGRALSAARAAAQEVAGVGGGGEDAAALLVVAAAEGAAVHALHTVLQEASRLYRLRLLAVGGAAAASSSPSPSSRRAGEWPSLREGLVQLARPPLASAGKLEYHRDLSRTYALFQP